MPKTKTKSQPVPAEPQDAVGAVAGAVSAAVPLIPAPEALSSGEPRPTASIDALAWPAAAVVTLPTGGVVGLLVGEDLVQALATAPDGPLDVGAALQPALDAAATALGGTASAAQTIPTDGLADVLGATDLAVPLLSGEQIAAVLVLSAVPNAAPQNGSNGGPTVTVAEPTPIRGVELLHGVAMEVTVELGRTRLAVRDLLALTPGDVLELDRTAGSPADLLVNGRLIARGEVVVVDENFALRVTEIVPQSAAG
jgi:flagellar motor switch protein FliN/FliY